MLKQILGENSIVGKTIEKVVTYFTGPGLLIFTDGTFAQISPERDWNITFDKPLNLTDFPNGVLVSFGVFTQEELDKRRLDLDIKRKDAEVKNRRYQYEQLKKEFGES